MLYGISGTSPDHVLISVFLRIFPFARFSFVPTWLDCGETLFDWRSLYTSWNTGGPKPDNSPCGMA